MAYKAPSSTLSLTPGLRPGPLPLPALRRFVGTQLSTLGLTVVAGGAREAAETQDRVRPGLAARVRQMIADVYTLAVDRESLTRVEMALATDLHDARGEGEAWRLRAQAAEKRVAELEVALAASEMQALELRSRVICLHGKLATSTATVRYQSMTLALEHPMLDHAEALAERPQA